MQNIQINKQFFGYAINHTDLLSAKNSLKKTYKKEKNLSQPINFSGTVYQRHISKNNVNQNVDAKLTNVGNIS